MAMSAEKEAATAALRTLLQNAQHFKGLQLDYEKLLTQHADPLERSPVERSAFESLLLGMRTMQIAGNTESADANWLYNNSQASRRAARDSLQVQLYEFSRTPSTARPRSRQPAEQQRLLLHRLADVHSEPRCDATEPDSTAVLPVRFECRQEDLPTRSNAQQRDPRRERRAADRQRPISEAHSAAAAEDRSRDGPAGRFRGQDSGHRPLA